MQLDLLLRARIILIWILKKRITEGIAKNAQTQICFPVSGFLTLLKGDRQFVDIGVRRLCGNVRIRTRI